MSASPWSLPGSTRPTSRAVFFAPACAALTLWLAGCGSAEPATTGASQDVGAEDAALADATGQDGVGTGQDSATAAGSDATASDSSAPTVCTSGIAKCDPNATCVPKTVSTYDCVCKEGFSGSGKVCCGPGYALSGIACNDVDECKTGKADCAADATCTNTPGGFTCACKAGFDGDGKTCVSSGGDTTGGDTAGGDTAGGDTSSGDTAGGDTAGGDTSSSDTAGGECKPGFEKSGAICSDINECKTGDHNCDANADCSNTQGSFSCKCKAGFSGDGVVCKDIDECAATPSPCPANSACSNSEGSYSCACAKGYKQAGSSCFDIDECLEKKDDCVAWCVNKPGTYLCTSSVADVNSPYYKESCNTEFSATKYNWSGTAPNETWEYQTKLIADCRCPENAISPALGGLAICNNPSDLPLSVGFGKGPSVRSLPNSSILGGAFDAKARVLYAGVEWQDSTYEDQGAVLAINVDTGDRTLISGQWLSPSDGYTAVGSADPDEKTWWTDEIVGVGQVKNPLGRTYDIEIGSDGYLYAMTADKDLYTFIVRVDIQTGARKVMWSEHRNPDSKGLNEPKHIQCSNGATATGSLKWVQLNQDAGFALDPTTGDYLLPVIPGGTVDNTTPNGVVRIAKDGSACTWVTRFGMGKNNAFYGQSIGTGPLSQFAFDAMYVHDGALYATSANETTFKINLTTGQRSIVASDTVGSGPTMGLDWLEWDPTRNLMWGGGSGMGTTIVSWDMATNKRQGHIGLLVAKPTQFQMAKGPLNTCCMTHRPAFVDPLNGDLIAIHNVYAIVRFEPASGNSVTISL